MMAAAHHIGRACVGTLLASLLLTSCSGATGVDANTGFAQGDGAYTRIAPADRVPAPVLTGRTLTGEPLTTAGRQGRIIVLNVWGSWCAPCRHEAPELIKTSRETVDVADVIGINTRDLDPAQAIAFTRTFGIEYDNFYDPDGTLLLQLTALPPNAIPSTVVIDQQGRIAARVIGETTAATLVGTIGDLVDEQ